METTHVEDSHDSHDSHDGHDEEYSSEDIWLGITFVFLTGLMIAGFIVFSGKLIAAGELEVNNFFLFWQQ